jgi:hypothetical protein
MAGSSLAGDSRTSGRAETMKATSWLAGLLAAE